MTGFAELKDQINKTTDLQEKELLQQDLIRGEWRVWSG